MPPFKWTSFRFKGLADINANGFGSVGVAPCKSPSSRPYEKPAVILVLWIVLKIIFVEPYGSLWPPISEMTKNDETEDEG